MQKSILKNKEIKYLYEYEFMAMSIEGNIHIQYRNMFDETVNIEKPSRDYIKEKLKNEKPLTMSKLSRFNYKEKEFFFSCPLFTRKDIMSLNKNDITKDYLGYILNNKNCPSKLLSKYRDVLGFREQIANNPKTYKKDLHHIATNHINTYIECDIIHNILNNNKTSGETLTYIFNNYKGIEQYKIKIILRKDCPKNILNKVLNSNPSLANNRTLIGYIGSKPNMSINIYRKVRDKLKYNFPYSFIVNPSVSSKIFDNLIENGLLGDNNKRYIMYKNKIELSTLRLLASDSNNDINNMAIMALKERVKK